MEASPHLQGLCVATPEPSVSASGSGELLPRPPPSSLPAADAMNLPRKPRSGLGASSGVVRTRETRRRRCRPHASPGLGTERRLPGRSKIKGEGGAGEMETAAPGMEFGRRLGEEGSGAPARAWEDEGDRA